MEVAAYYNDAQDNVCGGMLRRGEREGGSFIYPELL